MFGSAVEPTFDQTNGVLKWRGGATALFSLFPLVFALTCVRGGDKID